MRFRSRLRPGLPRVRRPALADRRDPRWRGRADLSRDRLGHRRDRPHRPVHRRRRRLPPRRRRGRRARPLPDRRALVAAGHDARRRDRPPRRPRRMAARAALRRHRDGDAAAGQRGRRDRRRGGDLQPARGGREGDRRVTLGYRGGEAWHFPDARSAAAFLSAARSDAEAKAARPPSVRWSGLAADAGGAAAVAVADLASAGLDVGADGVIGLRTEGSRRTLAVEVGRRDLRLFGASPASRPPPVRPAGRWRR